MTDLIDYSRDPFFAQAEFCWLIRSPGCILPVRDQGKTQSCFAFAIVDVIYASQYLQLKRQGKCEVPFKGSEQELVDYLHLVYPPRPPCAVYDQNMNLVVSDCGYPNSFEAAFTYIKLFGLSLERFFPYLSTCQCLSVFDPPTGIKIYCHTHYFLDDQNHKFIVGGQLQHRPLAACVYAPSSFMNWKSSFMNWKSSGVYTGMNRLELDFVEQAKKLSPIHPFPVHAVVLVGFGEEGGIEYYIAKNSWGPAMSEGRHKRSRRVWEPPIICERSRNQEEGSRCKVGSKVAKVAEKVWPVWEPPICERSRSKVAEAEEAWKVWERSRNWVERSRCKVAKVAEEKAKEEGSRCKVAEKVWEPSSFERSLNKEEPWPPVWKPVEESPQFSAIQLYLNELYFEKFDNIDDYYPDGDCPGWKAKCHRILKRFLKQVRESRGYDVDCMPPFIPSPFFPVPVNTIKKSPHDFQEYVEKKVNFVVAKINAEAEVMMHEERYELVDIEKVVEAVENRMTLFTFSVREVPSNVVKTVQAMVTTMYSNTGKLEEWRFKPEGAPEYSEAAGDSS